MGMRVKRSTGDWDKEFDMEVLGLSFKLKYVDPAHPIKGGKVHMKFPAHRFVKSATFDHDNTFEMTVSRVPGKSITVNFLQNGVGYTLVASMNKAAWTANVKVTIPGRKFNLNVALNPAGKYGVQVTGDINGPLGVLMVLSKDYKEAEINIKHRDNVYALVKLTGDVKMNGLVPQKFKYVSTYTFMNGPTFTMEKQEGQAKIHFDGFSPKKA